MTDSKEEKKEGEEILKERKEKVLNSFKSKLNWVFYLILALIVWINWKIRTIPMPKLIDVTTGGYTLGPDLDPFLFLRWAKYIVEHGMRLMSVDTMRYVPLGYNTSAETTLLPYMMAYFHKFLSMFSHVSVEYSSALFPAFISIFTTIAFFLLVRRIFREQGGKASNVIALIASAFLIVLPSLLTRTIAGIPEKESVGFFFMFLGFYFFLVAWQSKNMRNALIFGVLSGIATAGMGLVWGGVVYMFTSIGIAGFIAFVLNKVEKKELVIYTSWIVVTTVIITLIAHRYSIMDLVASFSSGISFAALFVILIDFIFFKTKIRDIKLMKKIRGIKLPEKATSLILSGILLIILTSIFMGPLFLFHFVIDIVDHLTTPYTDRLSFTVAENRQPFFSDEWKGSFGPVLAGIPLFFWLFFIGSIFLFNELIKKFGDKRRYILVGVYAVFLFTLIFSKYASGTFDGNTFISKFMYFGGMLLLGGFLVYTYYDYYKKNKLEEFKGLNFSYIFLLAYFIVSLLAARSAIRLIMALAPVAAIIVGYFVVNRFKAIGETKEETMKVISMGVMIIVLVASVYTIYAYYQTSVATAQNYVPDRYRVQWQKAMAWVRNETPQDAVFSHWWDYGYWVQTMGERATVLDGGNSISYWDHLMGRHVLTAASEGEAMEFMYTHNSSHLLIDPTEIGKYGAYSSIGSDENYDRYSWITTFIRDDKNTQERRNMTSYVYTAGTLLDEDYFYTDNKTGVTTAFPARRAGVGYLILNKNNDGSMAQPSAMFVYQTTRIEIPLRYLYINNTLYDFGSGYNGTIDVIPRLIPNSAGGLNIDPIGAAMFLSERNMRALWVRLYLLNQNQSFELVHSEINPIVEMIRAQGYSLGDFVYYGDVEGPIKIWKANFPEDIKANPEYLKTTYPESLRLAKSL